MKKIFLWVLMLIGMFLLSDFLINVGLNSIYKDIERRDKVSQISIYQADATYVNGRVRGIVKDTKNLNKKYMVVELYSKRDVLMGRRYIEVDHTLENQPFEVLFRAEGVVSYKMDLVDEKQEGVELEVIPKEMTKPEILLLTAITFLIFWG